MAGDQKCACGCVGAQCVFQNEAVARMRDALENLVIAVGMHWDLDGVLRVADDVLRESRQHLKDGAK